jgi:hypothetical protein
MAHPWARRRHVCYTGAGRVVSQNPVRATALQGDFEMSTSLRRRTAWWILAGIAAVLGTVAVGLPGAGAPAVVGAAGPAAVLIESQGFEGGTFPPTGWDRDDIEAGQNGQPPQFVWSRETCDVPAGGGSASAWAVGDGAQGVNLACGGPYPGRVDSLLYFTTDTRPYPGGLRVTMDVKLDQRYEGGFLVCATTGDPDAPLACFQSSALSCDWKSFGPMTFPQGGGQAAAEVWITYRDRDPDGTHFGAFVDNVKIEGLTEILPSPTPTETVPTSNVPSPTATDTPDVSSTPSPTESATATRTPTRTPTLTRTPTSTHTAGTPPTSPPSATPTPTRTAGTPPTSPPSATATPTLTERPTRTRTTTPSLTPTPTPPTVSPTPTTPGVPPPTASATPSLTPERPTDVAPTETDTPVPTEVPSVTPVTVEPTPTAGTPIPGGSLIYLPFASRAAR